jgi:hypothetical protein
MQSSASRTSLTSQYTRVTFSREMPLTMSGLENYTPLWKGTNNSERITVAVRYVYPMSLNDRRLRVSQAKLQSDIASTETKVEAAQLLDADLLNIISDIEGKSARIEKLKADITATKHDDRIADLNIKVRAMEDQRDNLTLEIRTLSLQSDARAKLTLHQRDVASKEREMKNM